MKIVLISKRNKWTDKLLKLLEESDLKAIYYDDSTDIDSLDIEEGVDWVFFFHWSKIVSPSFYTRYKCVVIHTGTLPQDRGGSPLQNQILKGRKVTNVNALIMQDPVDSGKVYCKEQITLQGNLHDIWLNIAEVSFKLIKKCVTLNPIPWPQEGEGNTYKRKVNNKLIVNDLESIYDQIRMLDAEDYPSTYLEVDGYRFEFSRAKTNGDHIIADVKIYKE